MIAQKLPITTEDPVDGSEPNLAQRAISQTCLPVTIFLAIGLGFWILRGV